MYYQLKTLSIDYLEVESPALAKNPLGDPHCRVNPVLRPREAKGAIPVVFVLAGFSGNGPFYLNKKFGGKNLAETLDEAIEKGDAPIANYVLVDAMTFWGGSQFINSEGCGRYEDYIVQDIIAALADVDRNRIAVMGGSSGGYGALHLASMHPDIFKWAMAIAPDSAFECSLLPELVSACDKIERLGGVSRVAEMVRDGSLSQRRDWHEILNVVGMAYCYGEIRDGVPLWPIDPNTAEVEASTWERWAVQDPVRFLAQRSENVSKLEGLFLEVGTRDQFHLQFGARRIHRFLEEQRIPHHYEEFEGTHFDIGSRRPSAWRWLKDQW